MLETIQILWATITSIISAIFRVFLNLLPFVETINSLKDLIYAELIGVPVWVVSMIGLLFAVVKICKLVIKRYNAK